jgi:hypothetical protein
MFAPLGLGQIDHHRLDALRRRHGTAQALALRARIVLLAAEGRTNSAIAESLGIDKHTAGDGAPATLAGRADRGSLCATIWCCAIPFNAVA